MIHKVLAIGILFGLVLVMARVSDREKPIAIPDQGPAVESNRDEPRHTIIPQPEETKTNLTHPLSGYTARLIQGDKYVLNSAPEIVSYYEKLEITSPNGETKLIEEFKPYLSLSGGITELTYSPEGNYLFYSVVYWESEDNHWVDVRTGQDIIPPNILVGWDDNRQPYIRWSPDGSKLAAVSYYHAMDGSGSDGVYVSSTGNPADLKNIFDFGMKEIKYLEATNNVITFTAIAEDKTSKKYQYDFLTATLIELP